MGESNKEVFKVGKIISTDKILNVGNLFKLKRIKNHKEKKTDRWAFRGQEKDWPLASSFERSCNAADIDPKKRPALEQELIREFQRKYRGQDQDRVWDDTLYAMSIMQHHGAPTRLLDANYSFYIALHFALKDCEPVKNKKEYPVIWCFNADWMGENAVKNDFSGVLKENRDDFDREDKNFRKIYMPETFPKSQFVHHENPLWMNERLIVQQGVFLCPADISNTFQKNIRALSPNIPELKPWYEGDKSKTKEELIKEIPKLNPDRISKENSLIKIIMPMNNKCRLDLLDHLQRMNITEATLFPDLDGFARSLKQSLPRLNDVALRRLDRN